MSGLSEGELAERTSLAITGAAGLLGSALMELLSRDFDIVGFDVSLRQGCEHLDVTDPQATRVLSRFDAILHLAAVASVTKSLDRPFETAHTNTCGTINVLEAARERLAKVVVVSSAAVYGLPETVPIAETAPCRPLSPYGVSKLASEMYASISRKLHGLPVVVVRPFNVYSQHISASDSYSGVIARFATNARKGRDIIIDGDGNQTRDFVHVSDLAQLIHLLLRSNSPPPIINCGTGHEVSIKLLANLIVKYSHSSSRVLHGPPRLGDIPRSCADLALATSIGYVPRVRIEDWLGSTLLT